jgi:hypothetical protein
MVDISAIAGTLSALKGAMDISKAMVGLHDAQAMQDIATSTTRNLSSSQLKN